MKQVSGRELARAIQRKGWSLARVQGSHHVFVMHAHEELARGEWGVAEQNLEVFVPAIVLHSNSGVCFHNGMLKACRMT